MFNFWNYWITTPTLSFRLPPIPAPVEKPDDLDLLVIQELREHDNNVPGFGQTEEHGAIGLLLLNNLKPEAVAYEFTRLTQMIHDAVLSGTNVPSADLMLFAHLAFRAPSTNVYAAFAQLAADFRAVPAAPATPSPASLVIFNMKNSVMVTLGIIGFLCPVELRSFFTAEARKFIAANPGDRNNFDAQTALERLGGARPDFVITEGNHVDRRVEKLDEYILKIQIILLDSDINIDRLRNALSEIRFISGYMTHEQCRTLVSPINKCLSLSDSIVLFSTIDIFAGFKHNLEMLGVINFIEAVKIQLNKDPMDQISREMLQDLLLSAATLGPKAKQGEALKLFELYFAPVQYLENTRKEYAKHTIMHNAHNKFIRFSFLLLPCMSEPERRQVMNKCPEGSFERNILTYFVERCHIPEPVVPSSSRLRSMV